jgi:hypothetical protein
MADCAATQHGDHNAYMVNSCRCPEARESYRLYRKQLREDRRLAALVDNTGTRRRLQALAAIGWSPRDLAERLGCEYTQVQHLRGPQYPRVTRSNAEKVAAVYEELQGTPGPSQHSRNWAEKFGWAPPQAWDDAAIDDPAAEPEGVGHTSSLGRVHLEDVQHLERFGVSRYEIARRMNVAPEAIERAEYRAQARARAAVERACEAIRAATQPPAAEAEPAPRTREMEHAR